tara:strand:+ start:9458 stop:11917 length:2460 start_codon:yes stop_codon:yes gene_type:complete
MSATYDPHQVEASVQQQWAEAKSFEAGESGEGEKYYCLAMFPYPSGQLHMGHVRCYTLGDVINRYHRLKGYNVMQPMGWDAFGLPAENAAIKHGIPPASWTRDNIDYMRGQMRRLGFGIDWSREFATCDPDYYHWEQWFFIKLYEKGLVYRKSSMVNWDPVDQTVLANEQVVDGRGWRSGAPVERREMDQWFLKITAYAEELLDELDRLEGWPESVKSMQRNWIGRSEGVEIDFPIPDGEGALTVYTTRPDTLLGATYVAVAAEHPLARRAAERSPEVAAFVDKCRNTKTAEADIATLEKEGVPTGLTVTHPLTGEALPVWVANFVLMEYGSGAVMSVPGHDQRDWEFARKYGIPIVQVIEPEAGSEETCDLEQAAFVSYGRLVNSGAWDGLTSAEAFDAIAAALEDKGLGRRRTNYRLRDWGVSRQRYWGCPIPMIHCGDCGVVPVPEQDLPVVLPTDVQFEGVRSPLTTMASFYEVDCPKCGKAARRETDTFDTFMESSWYYARFACPDANSPMVDDRVNYWTPVDHYVGGIEHAILHLLYARFFHKLMRDAGLVNSDEPFTRLLMLGMVLKDGRKMSKSSGDAGNPQALLDKYGADAVRTAMMFAAPPDQSFEWSEAGVEGQGRFCKRLWNLVHEHVAGGPVPDLDPEALTDAGRELRRKTHETLKRADDDYGRRLTFNTVVSAVHELANAVSRTGPGNDQDRAAVQEALRSAVLVLSPIAPHITQQLWEALGEPGLLVAARWPEVDEAALVQDSVELVVQVNGKVRGKITVSRDLDEDALREQALANENVVRFVEGKTVRKVINVPGKLINVVVG